MKKLPKSFKLLSKFVFFFAILTINCLIWTSLFWVNRNLIVLKLPFLENILLFSLISIFLSSLSSIFLFSILIKFLLKPVTKISDSLNYLAKGYLNYETKVETSDEFNSIAVQLNSLKDKFSELLEDYKDKNNFLNSEKNKNETILSYLQDSLVFLDLNYKIRVFNKASVKLTGYQVKDILGMSILDLFIIKDSLQEIPISIYCPKTGSYNRQNLKLQFKRTDLQPPMDAKEEASVNFTSMAINDKNNTLIGYLIILKDVSKENQLETMKVDFVSMAAHELRTPITSAKGYLAVFLQDYGKTLNEDERLLVDRINISIQQLAALTENLLNVSRIERGAISITAKPLDWVNFIRQNITTFLLRAHDKRIELNFIEPKEAFPLVQVDQQRIIEVLNNLLANGLNYTQSGGKVNVWLERKENEVITHVSDNGQGIPKDAIPKLFTKFFRASGKLERGTKGNGLGLYISKAIIELHHGKIWVESEVNKGTTFSFTLPVAIQNATLTTSQTIAISA